ncbi:MAG: MFS transporter [Planctomycetes bacterium]|nr:MFS transporter [Planctomycetota bacterium]
MLTLWRSLTPDGRLLFLTRSLRLFAYGFLSVVLALYLAAIGLSDADIGLLLSLTLLGDTVISLWITTTADRRGRRIMLTVGALLMLLAGVLFTLTRQFEWLLAAAIVGVISPSGKEVGPFLSIEQAALAQIVGDERRTEVFAWYNLAGSLTTALGAFCGGAATQAMEASGAVGAEIYRPVLWGYAVAGGLMVLLFRGLSPAVEHQASPQAPEVPAVPRSALGLHRSRRVVMRLSALFALDAFAGGFIIDTLAALWLDRKFGATPIVIGTILFWTNLLGGFSGLVAARLAKKFGLVNTMVFTHLPSNVMLILVPLMPSLWWSAAMLIARSCISQMDIPTRQAYTMAVVAPDERSAASGVTTVARSLGASLSPQLVGPMLANPATLGLPFFLAGGIKIVYDLLLYRSFVRVPESEATS